MEVHNGEDPEVVRPFNVYDAVGNLAGEMARAGLRMNRKFPGVRQASVISPSTTGWNRWPSSGLMFA